jgi:hypothetical protein
VTTLPTFGGCPAGTQFILLEPHQLPTDEQLAIVHADLDALIECGRLVVGELIGDEFEAEVARHG